MTLKKILGMAAVVIASALITSSCTTIQTTYYAAFQGEGDEATANRMISEIQGAVSVLGDDATDSSVIRAIDPIAASYNNGLLSGVLSLLKRVDNGEPQLVKSWTLVSTN